MLEKEVSRQEVAAEEAPPPSSNKLLTSDFPQSKSYTGRRHPWNVLVGTMGQEVLEYLRFNVLQDAGVSFSAEGQLPKNTKREFGRKLIVAGKLVQFPGSSMNGLCVLEFHVVKRFRYWREAFVFKNLAALQHLHRGAAKFASRLKPAELGDNGKHFLRIDVATWFASCCELHVSNGSQGGLEPFKETRHNDGGASVLHLGITLHGRRVCVCEQGDGLPNVHISNGPGTVYLGQLTGPTHQVLHQHCSPHELLDFPSVGQLSVTAMIRTSLFPYYKARLLNTTPNPPAFFFGLVDSFQRGLRQLVFTLPTLEDCFAAEASCQKEVQALTTEKQKRARCR